MTAQHTHTVTPSPHHTSSANGFDRTHTHLATHTTHGITANTHTHTHIIFTFLELFATRDAVKDNDREPWLPGAAAILSLHTGAWRGTWFDVDFRSLKVAQPHDRHSLRFLHFGCHAYRTGRRCSEPSRAITHTH